MKIHPINPKYDISIPIKWPDLTSEHYVHHYEQETKADTVQVEIDGNGHLNIFVNGDKLLSNYFPTPGSVIGIDFYPERDS